MSSALPPTLTALLLAATTASAAITIPTVSVGDAGNAADDTGYGAVAYDYRIGTHEVTNSQYTAFLNAVATDDPNGLYNGDMSISFGEGTYSTTAPNEPVAYTSFWDAARFANWLTNGQPTGAMGNGTTEMGAYTLTSSGISSNTVTRGTWYDEALGNTSNETVFAVASVDEWYKAAYYDGDGGYYDYPTQSNSITTADANYGNSVGTVTDVGNYAADPSHYGTFDQGGNVWELNDTIANTGFRELRGASFNDNDGSLQSSNRNIVNPTGENGRIGFRVTSLAPIPEPSSYGAIFGIVGLATAVFFRRRRRRE